MVGGFFRLLLTQMMVPAVGEDHHIIHLCSPGSSKIKGTDYGIYPIFDDFYDLLPGQYMYCPGSSQLASWAIHILPRKQVMKS